MRLESEPGRGSCFFFDLAIPSIEPPAPPIQSATTGAGSPLPPLRVLVAEDNAINQKVIDALLRRQGWTVVLAGNGKLACDLFQCQRFDAVLMDVQMPEMDGLEATGWIRQRERECACSCRVPIVALTAHANRAQHDQCIAAGMDGVVTKPVNLPALLACIAEVIARPGVHA